MGQNVSCGPLAADVTTWRIQEGQLTPMTENTKATTFPLRLPKSTRLQAVDLAQREGLSLNQFIALAVAEKITRLEAAQEKEQP